MNSSATTPQDLPLPFRLDGTPYELRRLLGRGGMGTVYEAMHLELRRSCVVKLLREVHGQSPEVTGRFRQEARLVGGLRHDALPTVYDLGSSATGTAYLAMEYLEGEDLRAVLRRRGPMSVGEAAHLAVQALEGLHVAHKAGVIHRDVKPENLFRTSTGDLKILDFGIAKALEQQVATGVNTAFGHVLGTPRYMSPEQALGRTPTHATDVYAIGCVLFELLAGSPVVTGNDIKELLRQHIYEPAPSLQQRTGRPFDPAIEAILARALAKDPAARFASASEMAQALRPFAIAPARGAAATGNTTAIDPVFSKPTVRLEEGADSYASAPPVAPSAPGALAQAIATDASLPRVEPSQATRLPDGVIDWSLSSQALAQELLAARTTAATHRRYPLVFTVVGLALGLSIGLAFIGIRSLQKHDPTSSSSIVGGSSASASALAEASPRPAVSAADPPAVPTATAIARPAFTPPSPSARPVGGAASIAASSAPSASVSSTPPAASSPPPTTTAAPAPKATVAVEPTAAPATTGRPSRPVESDRAD
jgi:serine/threonine protein kinase